MVSLVSIASVTSRGDLFSIKFGTLKISCPHPQKQEKNKIKKTPLAIKTLFSYTPPKVYASENLILKASFIKDF